MKIGLRLTLFVGTLCYLAIAEGLTAQSRLTLGDVLNLPDLEPVGEVQFRSKNYQHRNLLFFVSTKESAEQSKRWGAVIGPKFVNKIARWNHDHDQKVLVVPVLDGSVDALSYLPKWALKFLVSQLGGSDRNAILLDYEGTIRGQFQPISNDDTLLVLLGPDFKLQAFAIGAPSPAAQARLISALSTDVTAGSSSSTGQSADSSTNSISHR